MEIKTKKLFKELVRKLTMELLDEESIEEISTTAAVPGYMTPHAFSGKGKMDRRDSVASGSGYQTVNEAKYAVKVDMGRKIGSISVQVDAKDEKEAKKLVSDRLKGGLKDIKLIKKENVNEDINSSGYSQLKRPLQGATISIKILNKALKQQNDDKVMSEIEYLFEKAEEI